MKIKLRNAVLIIALVFKAANAFAQTNEINRSTFLNNDYKLSAPVKGQILAYFYDKKMNLENRQKQLIAIKDSTYTWLLDTIAGWKLSRRIINVTYDKNNNLISEVSQSLKGTTWVNQYKGTCSYNTKHEIVGLSNEVWVNGTWTNSYRATCTLDFNENIIEAIEQLWDSIAWINASKATLTYDAQNNKTSEIRQEWINGTWTNYSKDSLTYDINNNEISRTSQEWKNGDWLNNLQRITIYDSNSKILYITGKQWNGYDSWITKTQSTYTYNTNNYIANILTQKLDGFNWVNQTFYVYEKGNDYRSTNNFTWRNNNWNKLTQSKTIFDINDFSKININKYWDFSGKFITADSNCYYFHTINSSIKKIAVTNSKIDIYPNPSNGKFHVNYPDNNSQAMKIEIYNTAGEKIITQNNYEVDISEQPKSLYFVRVWDGLEWYAKKIFIQ